MPSARHHGRAPRLTLLTLLLLWLLPAQGGRPRPRLYAPPRIPPHLVLAEEALKELGPAGPIAARAHALLGASSDRLAGGGGYTRAIAASAGAADAESGLAPLAGGGEVAVAGKAGGGGGVISPWGAEQWGIVPVSPDRIALREFYNTCNGERWNSNRNWLVGEPCGGDWHGVYCSGGRVVELALNFNNVACRGQLNVTTLLGLAELLYLDLSDNYMDGPLPRELGLLPNLQALVLGGNRLKGSIPEGVALLADLRFLDLSSNELTGTLPRSLGRLRGLEVLQLGHNALRGEIPGSWSALSQLQRLSLAGGSRLGGSFPTWVGGMPHLWELTLHGVGLGGTLPESLDACTSLQVLNLAQNEVSGPLPGALARMVWLRELDLGGNRLSGTLPGELGALSRLRALDLSNNRLEGPVAAELGALTGLTGLRLAGNRLVGGVPRRLSSLRALRELRVGTNKLGGEFPGWLLRLPSLAKLSLDGNGIQGRLPGADLAAAGGRLEELSAAHNAITGALPAEIGLASGLAKISLAGNALTGAFPAALTDLTALAALDLGNNRMEGPLPPNLGRLRHLNELLLGGNRLSGPLPDSLSLLDRLRRLDLHGNAFQGTVPAFLASMERLESADLSQNALYGALPPSLWQAGPYPPLGGRVPPVLPQRSDEEPKNRTIGLGGNPLWCPLPPWARALAATCRYIEVVGVYPPSAPPAGGVEVTVRGRGLVAAEGMGCLFGDVFVTGRVDAAGEAGELRCAAPAHPAGEVTLRAGCNGAPLSRFGEPFKFQEE